MSKYIKLEDAIRKYAEMIADEAYWEHGVGDGKPDEEDLDIAREYYSDLPTIEVSEDMGEVSDGYHTFNQLYHQRAVLFATIVNQNKDKAWKSWKHEDDKFCFDKRGEWFIVGIDTPEGSYTYHYEKTYWDMFDCEELDRGKHWDGHTEEDVTRLLSLPPVSEDCISREWVKGICEIMLDEEMLEHMLGYIEDAPSVVPSCQKNRQVERAEGEWIETSEGTMCGNCNKFPYDDGEYHIANWNSDYCPNCGAKMKG